MASTTVSRRFQEVSPAVGPSLQELILLGERPDRATLVDWGCQLLEIVAGAHAEGILLRQLSEAEVIVTLEGRLVLAGLGRRRRVSSLPVPPPPEVQAGEPYTPRSDLFAVAFLLRRLAFGAGALRGRHGIGARDPLLKVLARATYTDPAARYATAVEMAEALREAGRKEAPRPARSAQTGAQVKSFPGATLRLIPSPPSPPASAARESGDGAVRSAFPLLLGVVMLLAIVLASAWLLLSWAGFARVDDRPAGVVAPLAAPRPPETTR